MIPPKCPGRPRDAWYSAYAKVRWRVDVMWCSCGPAFCALDPSLSGDADGRSTPCPRTAAAMYGSIDVRQLICTLDATLNSLPSRRRHGCCSEAASDVRRDALARSYRAVLRRQLEARSRDPLPGPPGAVNLTRSVRDHIGTSISIEQIGTTKRHKETQVRTRNRTHRTDSGTKPHSPCFNLLRQSH